MTTYDDSTITLSTGTQSYSLPSDFDRLVPNTFWDNTDDRQVFGGKNPTEWAEAKGTEITPIIHKRFRLSGTSIEFLDDVTAADNGNVIAFFYVSKNWALSSGSTAKSVMNDDADTSRIDEELVEMGAIWRVRRAKGLPWQTHFAEYQTMRSIIYAQDQTQEVLRLHSGKFHFPVSKHLVQEGDFPSA